MLENRLLAPLQGAFQPAKLFSAKGVIPRGGFKGLHDHSHSTAPEEEFPHAHEPVKVSSLPSFLLDTVTMTRDGPGTSGGIQGHPLSGVMWPGMWSRRPWATSAEARRAYIQPARVGGSKGATPGSGPLGATVLSSRSTAVVPPRPASYWTLAGRRQQPYSSLSTLEPDFSQVRRDAGQPGNAQHQGTDPRLFTYFMVGTAGVFSAVAAKSVVTDFVTSLAAAGDQLAQAQTEVDLSGIPEGKNVIIKWRGKPVFIRHRTVPEIEDMRSVDVSELRDPQQDADRVQKAEWLIMLGVCTHLGCVPVGDSGDYASGWYCPCHGSHYDVSGRIRKGPAPLNLEIPKYAFVDDTNILIG